MKKTIRFVWMALVLLGLNSVAYGQGFARSKHIPDGIRPETSGVPEVFVKSFDLDGATLCLGQENCAQTVSLKFRMGIANDSIEVGKGYSITVLKKESSEYDNAFDLRVVLYDPQGDWSETLYLKTVEVK